MVCLHICLRDGPVRISPPIEEERLGWGVVQLGQGWVECSGSRLGSGWRLSDLIGSGFGKKGIDLV